MYKSTLERAQPCKGKGGKYLFLCTPGIKSIKKRCKCLFFFFREILYNILIPRLCICQKPKSHFDNLHKEIINFNYFQVFF